MHLPLIPTLLIFLLHLPTPSSTTTTSTTSPVPTAIPPTLLATSYPASLQAQNPTAELQIRNTLAHYPLAIDGKNFQALDLVFAPDIVANYSAPLGVLYGLESVMAVLERVLENVGSQHALSTTVVEIFGEGGIGARSVAYFTASQFGVGKYAGQVLYSYGQYQDEWVKTCCPEEWRIKTRTLVYMGPNIGNVSIFT